MISESKSTNRRVSGRRAILSFLSVLLAGASVANAKTVMWLGNFYQQGTFQNGDVGSVDSVWVQAANAAQTTGYYLPGGNLKLARVSRAVAYVDTVQTKSSQTSWWSIANWNTSQYREGRFRMTINYKKYNGATATPVYQADRNETTEMNGEYTAAKFVIDSCVQNVVGDTVWMYFGLGQIANAQGKPVCSDHNPYLKQVGTVHLLNPWPGRSAWIRFDGKWQPMYPEPDRPGWLVSRFYALPTAAVDSKVLFASGDPASDPGVQYMDMTGIGGSIAAPWDFNADPKPWEKWIAPAVDGTVAPKVFTKAPALLRTLMVRMPLWNASGLRMTWKNVPGRFYLQSTVYCEWFSTSFYSGIVPTDLVINHPHQDTIFGAGGTAVAPTDYSTFTGWLSLASIPAGTDTIWINTQGVYQPTTARPAVADLDMCKEKILAFKVYDYKLPGTYFPFSEATNTGLLKGMVATTLGADGNVQSSGKSICAAGTATAACTQAANGPGNWFKPRSDNTTGCLQQPLTYNPVSGSYEFQSSDYFPLDSLILDTAYNEKLGGSQSHDFGFCMHAKSTFEYVPGLQFKFSGDDDVWIFIDKKLALDIGGQHAAVSGDLNLDKMGLVEGRAYQFDMFYCERHTPGSSIRIQTTMNLVPSFDFRFDSSSAGAGVTAIDLRYVKTEIDGSKCADEAANPQYIPGPGVFTLQYPDGHLEPIQVPPAAPQFKGIAISPDLSRIEVNIDSIKRSPNLKMRGAYKILVRFQNDPSQANVKEIPFSISGGPVDLAADLFDNDGDGRADSLVVKPVAVPTEKIFDSGAVAWIRQAWANEAGLRDSVLVAPPSISVLPDGNTMVVSWNAATTPFRMRTGCPVTGCLDMGWVSTWETGFIDTIRNPIKVLREHLGPYATSARYLFGDGLYDTLVVTTGEGLAQWPLATLASPWVAVGSASAPRFLLVPPADNPAPVLAGGRTLRLLVPVGQDLRTGDSLRLAERAADSLGNTSAGSSVWVPLSFGMPPVVVVVTDPFGLGRGTHVRVAPTRALPAAALATISGVQVAWNGQSRDIPLATLVPDPQGGWSGALAEPFAPGTVCGLGCWGVATDLVGAARPAAVFDGVPPAIVEARFRYSAPEVALDTFFVSYSEPSAPFLPGDLATPFIDVGRPARPFALGPMATWIPGFDASSLYMVVDTSWRNRVRRGDSARLEGSLAGSRIVDAALNAVGELSPWVQIQFGHRPPEFVLRQENPVLANGGRNGEAIWNEPPKGTPEIELLVRNDVTGDWVKYDEALQRDAEGYVEGGTPPINPIERVMGAYVKLNRPLEGHLFVYDNMGTFVNQVDLSPLGALWPADGASADATREVMITWNGVGPDGKFVAPGVYLMRALVKFRDPDSVHPVVRNLVWKFGWKYRR